MLEEPLILAGSLAALLAAKETAATLALRLTGLTWKCAAAMGIGLVHVGEFAFVLVLPGAESGVLDDTDYQRFSTLAIASLVLTPMLLKFGTRLVHEVESKTVAMVTVHPKPGIPNQAIVIGAGPVGRRVAPHLETSGHRACMLELSSGNLQPFDRQSLCTRSLEKPLIRPYSNLHYVSAADCVVV